MVLGKTHHLTRDDDNNVQSLRDDDLKDTFPGILHRMLEVVEAEGNGHIISWNPDGLSFSVHRPKDFADVIMGRYFKQTKYKSFQVSTMDLTKDRLYAVPSLMLLVPQRQLNLYHFTRNRNGEVKGIYCHPFFVRHDRALCKFVRRNGRKKKNHVPGAPAAASTVEPQPPTAPQQYKNGEWIPSCSSFNPLASRQISQLPYNMTGTVWKAPHFSEYQQNQPHLKEEPFPFFREAAKLSTEPSNDLAVENELDLASGGPFDMFFSGPEKCVQRQGPEGEDDDASSIASIEVDGVLTEEFLPYGNVKSLEGFSWQTSS
eukprot:Nitzschia sp. Nitz4//scaffold210_size37948//860//1885//NITZ4_007685-RA/size37948-augustus-gene-0.16-mRNA-1//1//CDS//3329541915//5101//frame0